MIRTTGCLSFESGREIEAAESRWIVAAEGEAEKKRKENAAAAERATAVEMTREMKTKVAAEVLLGMWGSAAAEEESRAAVEEEAPSSSSTCLDEIGSELVSESDPIADSEVKNWVNLGGNQWRIEFIILNSSDSLNIFINSS